MCKSTNKNKAYIETVRNALAHGNVEIKYLLQNALTDKINDREVYMKGIDASYKYEGYSLFSAEKLKQENQDY